MKKIILIASLVTALISTHAIAAIQTPATPMNEEVANFLLTNQAHLTFFSLKGAQAYADSAKIDRKKILTYVIEDSASSKAPKRIYVILHVIPKHK